MGVVGSRTFGDYPLARDVLDSLPFKITKIVSGGAIGADTAGYMYACDRDIEYQEFLPDWNKHGRSAGFRRNREIVAVSDYLVAFWDTRSKGTKHSLNFALQLFKIPVLIIPITPSEKPLRRER